MDLAGPLVFMQPLSHDFYLSVIAHKIVDVLQSIIKAPFGCEKPKITIPMAPFTPLSVNHVLYTYLFQNILAKIATKLLEQQCWATKNIGFQQRQSCQYT